MLKIEYFDAYILCYNCTQTAKYLQILLRKLYGLRFLKCAESVLKYIHIVIINFLTSLSEKIRRYFSENPNCVLLVDKASNNTNIKKGDRIVGEEFWRQQIQKQDKPWQPTSCTKKYLELSL